MKSQNMIKFLKNFDISAHLERIIDDSKDFLIIVSPYLKINDRIKASIEDKAINYGVKIKLLYGKNDLHPNENKWISSITNISTYFCKNLHAKCFLNEKAAIISSMNLYDFSQINNHEMGFYIEKSTEIELYNEISEEVNRLIRLTAEWKTEQGLTAYIEAIHITATGVDLGERWRIDRLKNVARFVKTNYGDLKIQHLHDHKGCLTVKWSSPPTQKEKEILSQAWENENEDPTQVEHELDFE